VQNIGPDCSSVQKKGKKTVHFFCASGKGGYTIYGDYIIDHDYLDHGYSRLPRDHGNVYNYTLDHSSQQRLHHHLDPSHFHCDRGREEKALDGDDDDKEAKTTVAQDFKSSCNPPLHCR
jgi:hypothetical protein